MRSEGALVRLAVDDRRAGPALRRVEHDHGPARTLGLAAVARQPLDVENAPDGAVECGGHRLVHGGVLVSADVQRRPTVTVQKLIQLLARNAREQSGICYLVAVQMQNRQHGTVCDGIEKLVRMPRGRERTGFGLAVADDAGDDQARIVEYGAERVAQ